VRRVETLPTILGYLNAVAADDRRNVLESSEGVTERSVVVPFHVAPQDVGSFRR